MTTNPPPGMQRVIPYLAYEDAAAALAFLCQAFGFAERFRMDMPDGRIGHAEIGYQDNVVMLASAYEELGFASPRALSGLHSQLLCYVDDVDAHYAHAKASGATILAEPKEEHGDRSYRAVDPQGHRWMFATHIGDAQPKQPSES